ncbi:MAG: hypothetical protein ACK6DB_00975, partial [Planctomycetota bacterium]
MDNLNSAWSKPVIEIKNLSRNFDQKWALQDVSLEIPRGLDVQHLSINNSDGPANMSLAPSSAPSLNPAFALPVA